MPFKPATAEQRLVAIGLGADKNPRDGCYKVDQSSMAHYPRKCITDSTFRSELKAALQPTPACFCCLGKAKPGEWLDWAMEPGQSFDQYASSGPPRPSRERNTIYLLPLTLAAEQRTRSDDLEPEPESQADEQMMGGTLPPLDPLVKLVQAYYQLEVRVLPPLLLSKLRPACRGSGTSTQYDATSILVGLKKALPPDAHTLCAVTMADIWHGDLLFVFGCANLQSRCGVFSFCRQDPTYYESVPRKRTVAEQQLLYQRASKTVCHEIGHTFGMQHCSFYQCLMQGSNGLDETDSRPMPLCPVCLRKLLWNLNTPAETARNSREAREARSKVAISAVHRYEALLACYTEQMESVCPAFHAEAEWISKRLKILHAGGAQAASSGVRAPGLSMLSESPTVFKSVSTKPLALRSAMDKSSARMGALAPGQRTTALELARTASGTTRVRTDDGWATAVTNTGKVLMRTCSGGGAPMTNGA